MTKRGRILRDTNSGPGLLMADGQQYQFTLEGMWRSDDPPRTGMMVEIEFDNRGGIAAITALPESQLAREQAEAAMTAARERGAAIASGAVSRFGMPSLIAAGCLLLGWWMLPAVSVTVPFGGSGHITFWQLLGALDSGNLAAAMAPGGSGSSGIYGLLAIVALVGPFMHHFLKDRRALLGGLLPLLFMLLVAVLVRNAIVGSFAGGGELGEFASQMRTEALKAVSVGSGVYLSLGASLYFAVVAATKYLAWGARNADEYDRPRKAAA